MDTALQREVARALIKGMLMTHRKGLNRVAAIGWIKNAGEASGVPITETVGLITAIIEELDIEGFEQSKLPIEEQLE